MKAVVVQEPKKAVVTDIPAPKLRPDYVKIKTIAVALNPTDWKHIDQLAQKGCVVGCDVAGTVVEVGSDVKSQVKPGDKIAGLVHGSNLSNHEDGGFAEYVVVKDGLFIKVPSSMPIEEASTLGVGITTVGQGLYQSLEIPWPGESSGKSFPILIYGGSTATGALAIQFAKLSGLEVIATASPRNFDYLKSLGADHVFDYKSPTCAEDIRKLTNNNLRYCLDCITLQPSMKLCAEALSSDASAGDIHYSALLGVRGFPRSDVKARATLAYTAIGERFFKRGVDTTPDPADYHYAVKFWKLTEKLFEEGKIKVHKPKVGSEGLEGVLQGLDLLRTDKVSGEKLVYLVADTPGITA